MSCPSHGRSCRSRRFGCPSSRSPSAREPLHRDPRVDADGVAVVLPVEVGRAVLGDERRRVDRAALVLLADEGLAARVAVGALGVVGDGQADALDGRVGRDRRVVHDPRGTEAVRLGRPHLAGRVHEATSGMASLPCVHVARSSLRIVWTFIPLPLVAMATQPFPSGRICGSGKLLGQTGFVARAGAAMTGRGVVTVSPEGVSDPPPQPARSTAARAGPRGRDGQGSAACVSSGGGVGSARSTRRTAGGRPRR